MDVMQNFVEAILERLDVQDGDVIEVKAYLSLAVGSDLRNSQIQIVEISRVE